MALLRTLRCTPTNKTLPVSTAGLIPRRFISAATVDLIPLRPERIMSRRHEYLQHASRLPRERAYRDLTRRVLITGRCVVNEILQQRAPPSVHALFVTDDTAALPMPEAIRTKVVRVAAPCMRKLYHGIGSVEDGPLALEIAMPEQPCPARMFAEQSDTGKLFLVLDSVQDPGNVGNLIRTASALGWAGVVLLPGSCDPWNAKCARAARGASLLTPLSHGTLADLAASDAVLVGAESVEAAARGAAAGGGVEEGDGGGGGGGGAGQAADALGALLRLHDGASSPVGVGALRAALAGGRSLALVVGSEGLGLRPEVSNVCALKASVPMVPGAESLNVAVAGGILMHALGALAATEDKDR